MMRRVTAVLLLLISSALGAEEPKAVLITGASTGIGRNLTEHLAAKGYFVYAGARKQADLDALNRIKNVQAVKLDVTKQDEIDAAVATITKANRGLYALVNNAGVATVGAATETSLEEFTLVMDVNVFGTFRVTKAFAPLIIASKGRISTISSTAGIGAPRDLTVYCMTKHAMEAFGDSLAAQMEPLGVKVSLIEPGNFNSELGNSVYKRTGKQHRFTMDRGKYKQPDEVSAAVELALFEATPKRRYMVTPDQSEAERTMKKQIEQLVQLNEGQPYTYDREELVKMLDAAMATARPKTAPVPAVTPTATSAARVAAAAN